MLALGVVIISRSDGFTGDLTSFLFGNPLGVTDGRPALPGRRLGRWCSSPWSPLYRPLLVLSFNETKAALLGLRPGATHLVMMVLVGLSVVASFRAVGTLMTFGLLVARRPPPSCWCAGSGWSWSWPCCSAGWRWWPACWSPTTTTPRPGRR